MPQSRRAFLKATAGIAFVGGAGWPRVLGHTAATFDTIHVGTESGYATIQAGVDAASPGDLVLVHEGTYSERVDVETPRITIRGVDRNGVDVDGGTERGFGFYVTADLVAIENLRVHHCTNTAVYWKGVRGFRGCYLTAHNNGEYGVYAYDSFDGRIERTYASANADAGIYLGHRNPFHALVTDVVAEGNGLGYSGTAAGGDLTIENSVWRNNWAGIVPNTLHPDEPQRSSRIVDNEVYGNNNIDAPALSLQQSALGTGILLLGASQNVIENNDVRDHENFGVAIIPSAPAGTASRANLVRDNTVRNSFDDVDDVSMDPEVAADLGLGAPSGPGNRFVNNTFDTSLPKDIERGAVQGSRGVTRVYRRQQETPFDPGDWEAYSTENEINRASMPDEKIEAEPVPARKQFSCEDL